MRAPRLAVTVVLAGCLSAAGLAASPARAEPHCTGEVGSIHMFTGWADAPPPVPDRTVPFPGTKVYGCLVGEDPDTRYVLPGARLISVRYTQDLKIPELKGHIKGLGLDTDFVLKRNSSGSILAVILGLALGPSWTYDSAALALDPTKTGNITATVMIEGKPVSETYRTVA